MTLRNIFFDNAILLSVLMFSLATLSLRSAWADEPLPIENSTDWYRVQTTAELGFVTPLSHRIQYGSDGTYFNYVTEGGQDVLFPFVRLSAEVKFVERHSLVFLLQPLNLQTEVILNRDIRFDGETFPADTPMNLTYGFSFPRLSYLYDFMRAPNTEISAGVSLQLRSANIIFSSSDGNLRRSSRDIGPVPILKFRAQHERDNGIFFGTEIDGFYAPGAIINTRNVDVLGAILDASVRAGVRVSPSLASFLNLRYLGGGADGETDDDSLRGDGFIKNWLHLVSVSLGITYQM